MSDEKIVVDDTDSLYRRLVAFYIDSNGKVSSSAYKNRQKKPDPQPSVDLARLTTPDKSLSYGGNSGLGVGELPAKVPLDIGFNVQHEPDMQNGNFAHCVILGAHTKETCRLLADATKVILPPPQRTSLQFDA